MRNQFELNPAGGGTGPFLEINGSPVMAGQFPLGWAPVGAVQTASGYEVAWSVPGQNEYEVWDTDSNGAYTSAATGILTGASQELEGVEANFGETFAGAGAEATPTTIASNGATTLAEVGNLFELNPAGGGTGPLLQLNGSWSPPASSRSAGRRLGRKKPRAGTKSTGACPARTSIWSGTSTAAATSPATARERCQAKTSRWKASMPGFGEDLNDDASVVAPGRFAGSLRRHSRRHATAFASIADPGRGVARAGVSSSLTAADLWSAHTTFSGGHALMT